jgi:hypothetical protein
MYDGVIRKVRLIIVRRNQYVFPLLYTMLQRISVIRRFPRRGFMMHGVFRIGCWRACFGIWIGFINPLQEADGDRK